MALRHSQCSGSTGDGQHGATCSKCRQLGSDRKLVTRVLDLTVELDTARILHTRLFTAYRFDDVVAALEAGLERLGHAAAAAQELARQNDIWYPRVRGHEAFHGSPSASQTLNFPKPKP